MTELPKGWIRATLDELGVEAQPGFASGKHNRDGDGIIHLRPMNVTRDGKLELNDVRYVNDSSGRRVRQGDVLFNNTNSPELVGKTALVTSSEPLAFSNHMTRLRPPQGLSPAFLAIQLHSLWMQGYFKSVLNNHVNQASVASKVLLQTPVVLPPEREQQRIVTALEEQLSRLNAAQTAISSIQEKALRLQRLINDRAVLGLLLEPSPEDSNGSSLLKDALSYRALMASKRRRAFNLPADFRFNIPSHWALASIDQLCWSIEYGSSAKAHAEKPVGGIPVLRMGNIQEGRISMIDLKYQHGDHPDAKKFLLEDGDLLFNRTNSAELVGKSAVYRTSLGPAIFASYLIRCRFVPGVDPDWVNLVINSSLGRSYIRSVVSQQVGQANVNGSKLARMPIPLPSAVEQRRILDAISEQREVIVRFGSTAKSSMSRAKNLRKALLASAFRGQLVSQDPADEPASVLLEQIRVERAVAPKAKRVRHTPMKTTISQEELPL